MRTVSSVAPVERTIVESAKPVGVRIATHRRAPTMTAEIVRADATLRRAIEFSGVSSVAAHAFTPGSIQTALDAVGLALLHRLSDDALSGVDRSRACVLLVELAERGAAVRRAEAARRATALSSVTAIGEDLGRADDVASLIERAPAELSRIGFERCLVSTIDQGRWVARSAFVREDPELARHIVAAGSTSPRWIDRSLLESELVRRRVPLLVTDAQHNPHVHRELIDATGTRAYVAAPVVVAGSVVAFVHADMSRHTGSVDEFDRELLGVAAECLGFAFECAAYRDRLQAVKRSVGGFASTILGMIDGSDETDAPPARTSWAEHDLRDLPPSEAALRDGNGLTRRECEVLDLMAAGQTNREIAAALFITEATIKAHVKHIFRKLAVANRAEAVSRYLLSR